MQVSAEDDVVDDGKEIMSSFSPRRIVSGPSAKNRRSTVGRFELSGRQHRTLSIHCNVSSPIDESITYAFPCFVLMYCTCGRFMGMEPASTVVG